MRILAALFVLVLGCDAKPTPAPTQAPQAAPVATVPDAVEPEPEAPQAEPEDAPRDPPMPSSQLTPAEAVPDTFKAEFKTTEGTFIVEVTKSWAPRGAVRFYNLVRYGFYDDVAFFRVIANFMVQFGIHGDPTVHAAWRLAKLQDDPVLESNKRGFVSFAMAGPNSRTTQVFINFRDNTNLDGMGFAPFGRVIDGMAVVDSLHAGYGEGAPRGNGPDQNTMREQGNAYVKANFPDLDWVLTARIL